MLPYGRLGAVHALTPFLFPISFEESFSMANHTYKNFASIKERVAWEDAVLRATKYMPQIVKDAKANSTEVATRAYHLYFGPFDKERWNRVVGTLSAIDMALQSAGITFVRVHTGKGANNCAATKPPYGKWSDQSPKQIADSAHKSQHAYVMTVGDHFYTEPNSIDRTIRSAQFNTVCHEMSHLVSGDVNDPVYGNVAARILAQNDPDEAIRCAENYGFYCEMLYLATVSPSSV
jgi:hypothetical protein